ncbi:alpha/beta hydrolase [Streptomyces sp. NPDC045470]|uniref:alpha/beta hydrolase n=1 Tax=Streptomyces sp. NPDC045470 TaxID=3155469 RepID=UPI0033BFC8CE
MTDTSNRRVAEAVRLRLPDAGGRYPVGAATLYLVDRTRKDPWAAEIAVRELMATVFYPAGTVQGASRARYMTRGVAAVFSEGAPQVHPELPRTGVDWAATTTGAYGDAPAQRERRWPVLLHSPGGGDPRALGTSVAADLASRGWVVVAVDHPGDALAVEFPVARAGRERVRTTVFRGDPRADAELFRIMIAARVADLRFVLCRLAELVAGRNPDAAGRPVPEGLAHALDLRRVGVYGHSAGGTAAAQALYEDSRIGAAVDWEGFLDQAPDASGRPGELLPVARDGVERALLLVGTDSFTGRAEMERSWAAALAHPGGRVCRDRLDGTSHWVFTDYASMAPQLQAAGLMSGEGRARLVGAADPAWSVPAVCRQVRTFFARHLPVR